jgi:hypothetical protein
MFVSGSNNNKFARFFSFWRPSVLTLDLRRMCRHMCVCVYGDDTRATSRQTPLVTNAERLLSRLTSLPFRLLEASRDNGHAVVSMNDYRRNLRTSRKNARKPWRIAVRDRCYQ